MKKILTACAIAASALTAAPAFAQGYIGLGVGSSRASSADGTVSGTTVTGANSSKTSYKIYGGFQFTPNWGVEAQYTDLGSRNFAISNPLVAAGTPGTGNIKANQFSIAGTGTLPLAQGFSLLGKLGVTANRASGSASAGFVINSANRTGAIIGVGAQYAITPKLTVRLEYEDFGRFSKDSTVAGGNTRANNTSLNLQYAF